MDAKMKINSHWCTFKPENGNFENTEGQPQKWFIYKTNPSQTTICPNEWMMNEQVELSCLQRNSGRFDGPTNGRTDKAFYRDAWTHLLICVLFHICIRKIRKNIDDLKKKILNTDVLIRKYHEKNQECETNKKKVIEKVC